jgi:hypothetical protein
MAIEHGNLILGHALHKTGKNITATKINDLSTKTWKEIKDEV